MGLTAERIHGRILDVDSHGDLATGPDGELFDDRVMRYFTTSPLLKMLGWTKDNDFFAIMPPKDFFGRVAPDYKESGIVDLGFDLRENFLNKVKDRIDIWVII